MEAKPSPSELTVLKLLWRREALSAREIHEGVVAALDWSYSSTRKTLERMEEKGLVAAREVHGIKVYGAQVEKLPTLSRLMRDFARQVLDLDSAPPVTAFADSPLLDETDLAELERLLEEKDGNGGMP